MNCKASCGVIVCHYRQPPAAGIPSQSQIKRIRLLGGGSSIIPTHWSGTKGLMWGARGSFPPVAAMVVMVVAGSWSLAGAHLYSRNFNFFYGINLFFGLNV